MGQNLYPGDSTWVGDGTKHITVKPYHEHACRRCCSRWKCWDADCLHGYGKPVNDGHCDMPSKPRRF